MRVTDNSSSGQSTVNSYHIKGSVEVDTSFYVSIEETLTMVI